MRHIRRILAILVAMGVIGAVSLYLCADRLIGAAVIRESSRSLGVATWAGDARLSLVQGRLSLGDFTIDNPAGYSPVKLLTLRGVDLDLPVMQLGSRPLHVRCVEFVSPRLVLERRNGKWNVQMLGHSSSDPLRLYIDQVKVSDAVVTLELNLAPGEKPMTVDVPPFTMDNVKASDGSGQGATIKDVLLQITRAMTSRAMSPSELAGQMEPGLPLGLGLFPLQKIIDPLEAFDLESK